jgi:hypothetical protein
VRALANNGVSTLTVDRTTDYFDEPFVDSSVFLSYWPDDIDIDDVKEVTDEGVNADEWMEAWEEMVSGRELRQNGPGCVKRSTDLNRRCPARRSEDGDDYFDNLDDEDLNDDNFRDLDDVHVLTGNDTVLERYVAAEEEIKPPPRDLMIRDPNYYVKRNPVAIFVEILAFVLRLGLSLVARTAGRISRYSPRLANIMNRNPDRLFKIAGRGKGTSRGVEGMKNAMSNIVRHPSFRQCILEGVP